MHLLIRSKRNIARPELLWREQVQQRVRGQLQSGEQALRTMSKEQWLARKAEWRQMVRQAILPRLAEHRGPVQAQIVSDRVYDGYRLQRIVFESFPGWKVGLNLYLPLGQEPAVPILCPCGHGPKWLDDHQVPPQVFARGGFAAALFDMPMFGEKARQNDHFLQGAQAGMVGLWSNYFFLVDILRTADYLTARPDIDTTRGLGITGVSGGGMSTVFAAVLDDRIRALAPVCCVVPFGAHLVDGLYTGCAENYIRGQAAAGLNLHHVVGLSAPLPCLIVGGTEDEIFRPVHVRAAFEGIRALYALEGAADRIALFFDRSPHKYTVCMARETLRWMNRWLRGTEETRAIPDTIPLLPEAELDCGTGSDTLTMADVIRSEVQRLIPCHAQPVTDSMLRTAVQAPAVLPEDEIEAITPLTDWGCRDLKQYALHSPGDLSLPLLRLDRSGPTRGTLICFSEQDKLLSLRTRGGLGSLADYRLLAADLRGFGELRPEPTDFEVYPWCGVDRALSDLLNLAGASALAQQVGDALRVLRFAIDPPPAGGGTDLVVYGRGEAALPALLAGLLCPEVKGIILDSFLAGLAELASGLAPTWLFYSFAPGLLKHTDLPALIGQRTEKEFLLINPCDATQQRLDETLAMEWFHTDQRHIALHVDLVEDQPLYPIQHWLQARASRAQAPVQPAEPEGDQPAVRRPLPTRYLGADLTGIAELRNLQQVLRSKTLFRHYGIHTPVMAETLERKVRTLFGCQHALAVTSGSAALFCAVAGLNIGPGDEVILPAFSWLACFNAVVGAGALPVFCDIDRTLNLDPIDLARKITARTKAVIVVHYQGGPARLDAILELTRPRGIRVLEDCAQAMGARWRRHRLGTVGDVGTFSLQGNKIVVSGEGGLVLTNDAEIFERAVRYHDLGSLRPVFAQQLKAKPVWKEFAGNQYRMNETAAAVALAQIGRLDWMLRRCRANWDILRDSIRQAVPDFRFRESGCLAGDAGITLFLDLGTPEKARLFSEAAAREGVPLGPSSGMVNLLTLDYVRQKAMPHPLRSPFGPGHPGASVVYSHDDAPNTEPLVASMPAIAIGPRWTAADARDVAAAIVKVLRHSRA